MDGCKWCGKALSICKEIVAAEGSLFCNKVCAIESKTAAIKHSARAKAIEWYETHAETIDPKSIGITVNKVVEILMKRDGITQAEAVSLVEDTRDELLDAMNGTSCVETDEIIMNNLGLEPDYLEDILEV